MKKYITGTLLVALMIVVAAVSMRSDANRAQAAGITLPAHSRWVEGWAWSSNIGWINSHGTATNGDTYGVYISTTTGSKVAVFGGYAWSSNIGWIKFGPTSAADTSMAGKPNATVNLSSGQTSGFVRACAGTVSGDCSTAAGRTDGWDGWIELSGSNHGSNGLAATSTTGVWMNPQTGYFSGFAWGDTNVGWLSFNPKVGVGVYVGPYCTINGCGFTPDQPTPSCSGGNCPPIGGGGGTTPYGTCVGNVNSDNSVTFTATVVPTSGASPYTYNWKGLGYTSNASFTTAVFTPGSNVPGPTLYVKDGAGNISAPGGFICNPVGITGTNSTPGISLLVGDNQALAGDHSTAVKSFKTKQGYGFTLVRNISLTPADAYDVCSATVDKGSWTRWTDDNETHVTNGDINRGKDITSVDTTNNTTGTYEFKITCQSSDFATYPPATYMKSASAFVTLQNSQEGEH